MDLNHYKSIIKSAPFGYAYHKIICDENDAPVDYIFLDINSAFEDITGLKRENVLNQLITNVLPGIKKDSFDWIAFYGQVALAEKEVTFEQFSQPLNKWFKVQVFCPEKYYFTTIFTDITLEKKIADTSKYFLEHSNEIPDFEKITNDVLEITGAKYVAFNLFETDGKSFTTMGLAGVGKNIKKAISLIGFNIIGKTWPHDSNREEIIKDNDITYFKSLKDLSENAIPSYITQLLEHTFGLGAIYIAKISRHNKHLGDFTIMLGKNELLKNTSILEIYLRQLGLVIQRYLSDNELKEFFNVNLDLLCIANTDGYFVRLNKEFENTLGYSISELEGRKFLDFVHPDDIDATLKKMSNLDKQIRVKNFVNRYRKKDGSYAYIEWRSHPKGNLIYASARDITDKVLSQQLILENQARYKIITENISDFAFSCIERNGIYSLDWLDGNILGVTSFTKDEIIHRKCWRFLVHPDDLHIFDNNVVKLRQDNSASCTLRIITKDKTEKWLNVKTSCVFDKEKNTHIIYGGCKDITQEKKNQLTIDIRLQMIEYADKNSLDELLQYALDLVCNFVDSPIGFYHFLEADQKTLSLQQWSTATKKEFCKADGKGLHYNVEEAGVWVDCIREKRPIIHNDYQSLTHKKGLPEGHAPVIREMVVPVMRDRKIMAILGVGNKPQNYNEKDIELVSFIADITWEIVERKKTATKIKNSEEKYRLLTENATDIIWIYNLQKDTFVYMSPAVKSVMGYTSEEALLNPLTKIINEEIYNEIVRLKETNAEVLPKPFLVEVQQKHKNGEWIWLESSIRFRLYKDDIEIVGVTRDISDRKKAEDDLKESENLFRTLTENLTVGVAMIDKNMQIITVNYKIKEWFPKDNYYNIQCYHLFSYDEKICENCPVKMTFNDGLTHKIERTVFSLRGKEYYEVTSTPIFNEAGEVVSVIEMIENITEKKKNTLLIEEQKNFQQLVAEISSRFLSVDIDKMDNILNWALEQIGKTFNLDRVYIFSFNDDKTAMSITHEWVAQGIEPFKTNYQNFDFNKLKWWTKKIFSEKYVHIPNVNNLPGLASVEKNEFISQKIKSLINFPFYNAANQIVGLISMDVVKSYKNWDAHQISLFDVLSNVISDAYIKITNEKEIRKSKELAESANKAKTEFLSNMSHEIRTPLNGVVGFTDLLTNTPLNDLQKQFVDNINVSAQSLLGVISDILDFSKIEAGKIELELIKTDIVQTIEQAIDISKYNASQKRLELILHIENNMPRMAVIDPVRLKQVLVNLLGNAVKFTETGEVELKVSFTKKTETNGLYHFAIRDTGIGIAEEQKNKLFKAFSQADTSTTRKYGGTGLGLIISNHIAKKMNSEIHFKSEINKGSTFYFDLKTAYEHNNKNAVKKLTGINKVLIIDDNATNRAILEYMLTNWEVSFESTNSGVNALNILENNTDFDIILIDYHMPYMDGLETIRNIKKRFDKKHDKCGVILLHSSLESDMIYKECKILDIRFNLVKPVKADELYYFLNNIKSNESAFEELPVVTQSEVIIDNILNVITPKIIIAEDVAINMMVIKAMLKRVIPNAVFFEAENGVKVLDILKSELPDLIFMDIQMPEKDGLETTKEIRLSADAKISKLPIIALTAGATKDDAENCFKAGMNDYLSKPIEKDALLFVLEKHLLPNYNDASNKQVNSDNHFNKKNLLQKIENDQTLYASLIETAKRDVDTFLFDIEKNIFVRDFETIRKNAHAIKGIALNMFFPRILVLAKNLELNARLSQTSHLNTTYHELKNEWQLVQSFF